MRVGIVTQPLEMNYGGILQNWALQQALKSLGHEPITIDAYQRYSTVHYWFNCLRAGIKRMTGHKAEMPHPYKGALRYELLGRFVEEQIDKTRVMWDYKRNVVKRYGLDALVVGSDQVWRAKYNGDHLEDMYLAFAVGFKLKRVAYAASFGVDQWEYTPEQTARCAALAQQMDAVSVREQSGVALCHDHLKVDAECVVDPTMLLDAQGYNSIIDHEWDGGEPYLAVYCLDVSPEVEAFVNQLAASRGLQVRMFSAGWKSTLSVGQWLAMLSRATVVVTDSFHGTVFSILFGRDFYNIGNAGRGNTRIYNLLRSLGLEERLLTDLTAIPVAVETDWGKVHGLLAAEREKSMAFLANNL